MDSPFYFIHQTEVVKNISYEAKLTHRLFEFAKQNSRS